MKLPHPLKFAPDLAQLDRDYRARRTGQSPVEYASSIQRFRRPKRQWPAWIATAAILLAALIVARA